MRKTRTLLAIALGAAVIVGGVIVSQAQSNRPPTLTSADYSDIQHLYARYAQALDLGMPEDLADVFTDDGQLVGSHARGNHNPISVIKGRAALLEMEKNHGNFGSRHFTSNLVLKPVAGGVKATCYMTDINVADLPATVTFTGVFEGLVVKTAQGWKFKELIWWRDDDDVSPTPFHATRRAGRAAAPPPAATPTAPPK